MKNSTRSFSRPFKIIITAIFGFLVLAIGVGSIAVWRENAERNRVKNAERDRMKKEKRARQTALKPIFDAMTPEQHLTAAREFVGKDDIELQQHVAAIPKEAEEYAAGIGLIEELKARQEKPGTEKNVAYNPVIVTDTTYRITGSPTTGLWKVTFQNRSKMAVGNLKFKTAYYSETGRVVSRGGEDSVILPGIIEEVIPPLSIRTFLINDGYLSSESSRASFTPTGWEYVTDKR